MSEVLQRVGTVPESTDSWKIGWKAGDNESAHSCNESATVYKGKGFTSSRVLDIKTHTKTTETYQYLHRASCHPDSIFRGFIKGTVILRIRTNSDPDNLKSALANFKTKLIERG